MSLDKENRLSNAKKYTADFTQTLSPEGMKQ
jgi:hypothetical protein